MKIILSFIITTINVIILVSANPYYNKTISYSGDLQHIRFFGGKCVFWSCNENSDDEQEEKECTFYWMKRVDDELEETRNCTVKILEHGDIYDLEPFGSDHVYVQLNWYDFIVVNLNDCRYVESKSAGNYTADLVTFGVDVEKVFLGSLLIFSELHDDVGKTLQLFVGFDSQDNRFQRYPGLLSPQLDEACTEYQTNNLEDNTKGIYMYDRDHGLQKFWSISHEWLGKSNNLISSYLCKGRRSKHCKLDQYDLNGELMLSYELPIPNKPDTLYPVSVYNLPGGGFLLATALYHTMANHQIFVESCDLIEVDANGHLIDEYKQFINFRKPGGRYKGSIYSQVYKNDDNKSCVIYAEVFELTNQLYIAVKCTEAESSTLSHGWNILFICFSVILCACLLAWLLHVYNPLPRLWSCLTSRSGNTSDSGSNVENTSQVVFLK